MTDTPPNDLRPDWTVEPRNSGWQTVVSSMAGSVFEALSIPIHRAGWPFIIGGILGGLLFGLIWGGFAILGLVFALACVFFFRDPVRCVPQRDGLAVSPADGRVIAVEPDVSWPDELSDAPRDGIRPTRVSIFLSVFNVHVIRSPIAGTVTQIIHRPGTFVNASLDKASEDNERVSVLLTLPSGEKIGCVLIAGLVARRIVPEVLQGQIVATGERIGIIRFGSRVDLYLPPHLVPLVGNGQTAIAGETIITDLIAATKGKEKAKAPNFAAI
jgi:phosphatidylserine decarboxylase